MKKILVSVMILLSFTTMGFASNPEDYSTLHKLNNKEVFTILTGYINADEDQASLLKNSISLSDRELYSAEKSNNEKLASSAVNYNLHNAKCYLGEEQYKKYLAFINYYLKNDNMLLSLNNK